MDKKWSVRLIGERFDLEDLPRWFNSNDEINVTTETGNFFLNSDTFKHDDDYNTIVQKAEAIIIFINGISRIKRNNFKPIFTWSVISTDHDGAQSTWMPLNMNLVVRDKVYLETDRGTSVCSLSELIKNNEETTALIISEVIRLWGNEPHNWSNFYKIIETITKNDSRKEILFKEGIITREKYNLLRQTANSYEASGNQARHAKGAHKTPPKPMQLHEAEQIMHSMIKSWLDYKGFSI
ncbi:MAG: hypothetical protein Q3M30_11760 [Candidatus Electrothrix sp. Rat3]|nr:hypothetical protein [Candidatus Electrothrix rattekaaiensis]